MESLHTPVARSIVRALDRIPPFSATGRVAQIIGLSVEVVGLEGFLSVGDHCWLVGRNGQRVLSEAVGFRDGRALLTPFGRVDGIGIGCQAEIDRAAPVIYPDDSWLGRVVDAFAAPVDGGGALQWGAIPFPLRTQPPPAHSRARIGDKLDLGVRALNIFVTCCQGQRLGIFSGSGIGKSTLLSMMARFAETDVIVIGLIGERGREAREFIEDHLGEAGLARSILVVATSDEPPLVRRQAAYTTLSIAEYFRSRGRHVLCLMDSVTRFAMAQREIGLAVGEPPVSKGYTPSVFAELPKLLERAGPGREGEGSITGIFTVLVEGDDHDEPVADAVRSILDGHVVLDRAIAERGRHPPINVLRSVSRTMPGCNTTEQNALVDRARRLLAVYDDMADLIRLGAYRAGSDAGIDEAIRYHDALEGFLAQDRAERSGLDDGYVALAAALEMTVPPAS